MRLAVFPAASKMELTAGRTINSSFPSGVPEMVKGRAYVFPLTVRLEGLGFVRVATPPVIDKTKSLGSNAPVVSSVL